MRLKLSILALSSSAFALPFADGRHYGCLSDQRAAEVVETFTQALRTPKDQFQTYVDLVQSIVNPNYREWSDSVNFFSGAPAGTATVSSFADLVSSHQVQGAPAYANVTTVKLWHSCDVITWLYDVVPTEGASKVRSLMALVFGDSQKLDAIYYEFNNARWAEDLGYTFNPPETKS